MAVGDEGVSLRDASDNHTEGKAPRTREDGPGAKPSETRQVTIVPSAGRADHNRQPVQPPGQHRRKSIQVEMGDMDHIPVMSAPPEKPDDTENIQDAVQRTEIDRPDSPHDGDTIHNLAGWHERQRPGQNEDLVPSCQ